MHNMDREYNEHGELVSRDEGEVRRDEELSGRKDATSGKRGQQDPEPDESDNRNDARDSERGKTYPIYDRKGKNRAEVQLI